MRQRRRSSAERKKANVKRWMREAYRIQMIDARDSFHSYTMTYVKRLGPGPLNVEEGGNAIEIICHTEADMEEWLDFRARVYRDNPKCCSCYMCRNVRGPGNHRQGLTIHEMAALERYQNQLEEIIFERRDLQQDRLSLLRAS